MNTLLATTGLALAASALATPLVRRAALRLGIVDQPDGHRKLHASAIPLGGGVAVLLGAAAALGIALIVDNPWRDVLHENGPFLGALGLAVLIVCGVGLLDDRFSLRGRQKLLGQIVAAGVLIAAGLTVHQVQIFDWEIQLGVLAVPFTLFWLLGAINALNLIDGVDGLATTVGLILSMSLAAMAHLGGHPADAIVSLAIAGSLAGFLFYNFPPARIFLGDAGSMLIGLVLGALAIRSSLKGPATVALAAPTAIWAIPIFDVSMAILRRKLTGRSIYTTDRGHLHHCLLRRGFSGAKTLAWIGVLCAVTAAGALASVAQQNEMLAVGAVLAVTGTLVATRFFGHAECQLLCRRIKHLLLSLVPLSFRPVRRSQPLGTRLQGTRKWDELWRTLTDFAERFDVSDIQLNVHLPAIDEEYHAHWERKQKPDLRDAWRTDIPLFARDVAVGRLRIAGARSTGSVCLWMGELIAGLKPFEMGMLSLIEGELRPPRQAAIPVAVPSARHSLAVHESGTDGR
ncbi:MAG TPA: MraY family glycosyltransferase [Planctomycetaceae bacterium]|nr:MraY family glycosyltransferase [Planctomycetaceae bacterium]